MGKRGKHKRELDDIQQAREVAKKERKRKKKAEARFASAKREKKHLDQNTKDFFSMCDKKRAYRSEMDAMMAAAHSRSGDMLRWYKCPFSSKTSPHWHLTKMSEEAFEEHRDIIDKKEGRKPKYDKPPVYVDIDEPCFVVKSTEAAFPVLVFGHKIEALKWVASNKSFEPIEDTEENRQWLESLDIAHYEFSKSGILCVDTPDAIRVLGHAADRLWDKMETAESARLDCFHEMVDIRKNYRRLNREAEMDGEYRKFVKNMKKKVAE